MRTSITIQNLRGIEEGTIEDLAPLSILVGSNNTGKSTVLEALWFNASRGDASVVASMATRRGWCGISCVEQLFYRPQEAAFVKTTVDGKEISTEFSLGNISTDVYDLVRNKPEFEDGIQILAECNRGQTSKLALSSKGEIGGYLTTKSFKASDPHIFVAVETITEFGLLEDAFSDASAKGKEAEIEALLARIGQPNQSLRILKRGDQYVLHTIFNGKAVAVYFSGDGYKRLLYIACVLAAQAGGLVLLEEPECFQHPKHLRELAQLIWGAIDQGTQVVLSTHSLDLLRHIFFSETARLEKAAVFRTTLKEGRLAAVRIAGERAKERLEELGEDLRQ